VAAALVFSSLVSAATLNFGGSICNGGGTCVDSSAIDQFYGDIAGEVDIQWDANRRTSALENVLHGGSGYESLTNVAYALKSGTGMSILMLAATGYDVTLGSLDIARYANRVRDTQLQVTDLEDGSVVADSGVFATTFDGVLNYSLNAISSAGFEILFGPDAWNVGISNIMYSTAQTPNMSTVPLPAACWMLLAGLGGLVAMRRKRS
jgi:hypothetical protein